MRIRLVTVAAMSIMVLAVVPCAQAAFPGRDGQLVFELTSWDDSGAQFSSPPNGHGAIDALVPGKRRHALLSCSGNVGSLTVDDTELGGCEAGGLDGAGHFCFTAPHSPCLDDSKPSFSADGTRIVFSDDPCARRYCRRITLIDADGSGETQLPALTADDAQPAFLASGGLVFAGRATRKGPQNLYTVGVDGSGLRQLTHNGAAEPAPCTNGSIAFVHSHDLYLRGAAGRLRTLAHGASWPDCSPNSRQIAFLHNQDLYLISTSGKGLRRLTSHRVAAAAPAFSPDGRLIALNTDHKPSKHWPPKGSGIQSNVYLQIVDLQGHERRKPVYLGNIGADQDGFPFATDAGGISWQPEHALAPATF